MDNPIEINQIELPVSVSLLLNQQIGVSHVAGIQSCGVKRAQELGEGAQKRAPLLEWPVRLALPPIDVERHLGEESFAAIHTLPHGSSDSFLDNRQRLRYGKPPRLEQLCPMPGPARWGALQQRVSPATPRVQAVVFHHHCSTWQRYQGHRRPVIVLEHTSWRPRLRRAG